MTRQVEDIQVLVVTDDPAAPRELDQMLGDDSGVTTLFADTSNAVSRTFESDRVDLVVVHVSADDPGLLESTVSDVREQDRFLPVIAVVESDDADSALAAAALGVEGMVGASAPRQLKRLVIDQVDSIRARHDAHIALRNLNDIEARYTLLLDSSSEAIAYLHEGLHIYANPAYLTLFGFERFEDLEGLSILDLFSASDEVPNLKKVLKSLSRGKIPPEALTLNACRQDGTEFSASVDFSPARYGGEGCSQMLVREQVPSADPELTRELEKLRTSDMLTDLLNARAFMDSLAETLVMPDQGAFVSVLTMSLDNHDELLEKLGISATDNLIKESARLFRSAAPKNAVMSRLRDHTFAMVAETSSRAEAEKLASHLVEHCSGRILDVSDTTLTASVSVGLALAGSQNPDPEKFIAQAEQALHEAIRAGGNSFVRYRPRISAGGDDDGAAWAERLQHAMDHDELSLVVSAITCMEDDEFLVNEVETRLRDDDSDEVLLPEFYLQAASRIGMAPRLDQDMLNRLARLAADRQSAPEQQWLVTLSTDTLVDEETIQALDKIISNAPFSYEHLIWGFREPEIRERLRQGQAFVEQIKPRGSRFALCDVGSEADVAPILRNLDLDFMRLTPETVHDLGNNEKLRQRVSNLAGQAKAHEVRVIAPKVDNTGDLATLWQFGITLVQGDFLREVASA